MLDNLIATLAVPPVPSPKNMGEPLQPTETGAVPPVPPVPSLKTKVKAEIENNTVEWREYLEPDGNDQLTVICYTPAGNPVIVEAKDEAHKAYLLRTNPPARKDTK
jgi:hypothetical protein